MESLGAVWFFGFLLLRGAHRRAEHPNANHVLLLHRAAGLGGTHIPYRDPPATIALASLLWEESKPRTERLQSTAGCSHVPQGKTTRG